MEGARTRRRRTAPQAISPVGCCLELRVAAPSIRLVPWVALASCWPLPQQLLLASATGRSRRCCRSQWLGMSTVEAVDRKISWLFCFSGRVCTLLHISCTLYKKAMNSLHRLHSVYFAAQKRIFYAKSTRVSSRRSSASICRMASRIILPVIFVATGVLFSGGSCGFAPATSCV